MVLSISQYTPRDLISDHPEDRSFRTGGTSEQANAQIHDNHSCEFHCFCTAGA
ncbi:MAG: hypothetical protein DMG75_02000 [Acidobacteria bacterium]|nr:MAG: hypothetical protein DMG75_02000 [Acidobacteriota bacterium]